MNSIRFNARTITGAGRGKTIGTPTINMNLNDIPEEVQDGIYACWTKVDGRWTKGALHYGPRPVFKDTRSCEVYLLDVSAQQLPERVEIVLIDYLRPIMDFPSPLELIAQIQDDVTATRAMLKKHGPPDA